MPRSYRSKRTVWLNGKAVTFAPATRVNSSWAVIGPTAWSRLLDPSDPWYVIEEMSQGSMLIRVPTPEEWAEVQAKGLLHQEAEDDDSVDDTLAFS